MIVISYKLIMNSGRLFKFRHFIHCILCVAVFFAVTDGIAQTGSPSALNDIPKMVPASPDAASLGKFGQIPVGYYRGIANISVPLFTIREGNMSLPISLDYHSGAVKVEEMASSVGLGWALNAGGIITRSLKGLEDEGVGGFSYNASEARRFATNQMSESESTQYMLALWRRQKDGEPDIYYYNFGGVSGKFFNSDNGTIFTSPRSDLKVEYNADHNGWIITDGNGIKYTFFLVEQSNTEPFCKSPGSSYISNDQSTTFSSWFLTKMEDPFGNTITLKYDNITTAFKTKAVDTYNIIQNDNPSCPAQSNVCYSVSTNYTYRLREISFSNGKIIFDHAATPRLDLSGNYAVEKVTELDANNSIIKSYQLFTSYFETNDIGTCEDGVFYRLRLDSLQEIGNGGIKNPPYIFSYNQNNKMPCRLSNAQDYWGYYNGKNNLTFIRYKASIAGEYVGADKEPDTLKVKAGVMESIQYPTGGHTTYSYEVNRYPNYVPPGFDQSHPQLLISLFGNNNGATDYISNFQKTFSISANSIPAAGYRFVTVALTTSTSNNSLYHVFTMQLTGNNGFSQTLHAGDVLHLSAGDYTLTGTIETENAAIPSCQFSLYLNESLYTNGYWEDKVYGGIRVKEIKSFSDANNVTGLQTIYYTKFDENDLDEPLSSGQYGGLPDQSYYEYDKQVCDTRITNGDHACCPIHVFNSVSSYPLLSNGATPIGYKNVTVLYGADGKFGKDRFVFTSYKDAPQTLGFSFPFYFTTDYDWRQGLQLSKETYRYDNGNFIPVQKNVITYDYHESDSTYKNSKAVLVGKTTYFDASSIGKDQYDLFTLSQVNYDVVSQALNIKKEVTTTYDSKDASKFITLETSYDYSPKNFQMQKKTTIDSKGRKLISLFTYPLDFSVLGTANNDVSKGIQNLQEKHVINPVIEQFNQISESDGSNLRTTGAVLNMYKVSSPVVDVISKTESISPMSDFTSASITANGATFDARYSPGAYLTKYDISGNLLEAHKAGDVIHSYIWDYNNKYTIADVINASASQIAYTSFEANGTGGWTLGQPSAKSSESLTGAKAYNLVSDISKGSLNPTTTYVVSYWAKVYGPYAIPGTMTGYPTTGKTIDGWTLYVHRVTGQSTISLQGAGLIDELRLYPLGAQMTTYTYSPLIGMTSQCDIGNRVTYYEYDGLARLKRIRDQDHNILKSYEYEYQASAGCGPNCYSINMQNFAGNPTVGYPVGVFNVEGKLLGNASNASQYTSLWNNDATNAAIGTLSSGSDPLHFNITINASKSAPAFVTGCRYYQIDLPWTNIDGVRNKNAVYIDFGDGTGMKMGAGLADIPSIIAPNTIYKTQIEGNLDGYARQAYFKHTYPNDNLKTLTFYHNDAMEFPDFDNVFGDAYGLSKLRNLRGNLPLNTPQVGGSSYQESSMSSTAQITNWNDIHGVTNFRMNNGDALHPWLNVGFTQDFMAGNPNLAYIQTVRSSRYPAYYDPSFTLARLKSDWNTYFTKLHYIRIHDDHWNHENLTALTKLEQFILYANTQDHMGSLSPTGSPWVPIPSSVIDNIINQIAAGAGQTVTNGVILINSAGGNRTSASNDAVQLLLSKGWTITINTDAIPPA